MRRATMMTVVALGVLALGAQTGTAMRVFPVTNYQGIATDNIGNPVADGPHVMDFSIWDAPTSGNMLWSESQTVITSNGLFNASLGAAVHIQIDAVGPDSADTNVGYWLETAFEGETISPRTEMSASFYARVTERITGDITTRPGVIDIPATEELFGTYSFVLENSSGGGASLRMNKAELIDAIASASTSVDDTSASSEMSVKEGGANSRTHVVATPLLMQALCENENALGDTTRTIDVSQADGRTVTSSTTDGVGTATLTHTQTSDRNEMRMGIIRNLGLHQSEESVDTDSGYSHEVLSTDGNFTTTKSDKASPKLLEHICKGTHASGDSGLYGVVIGDSLNEDPGDFDVSSVDHLDPLGHELGHILQTRHSDQDNSLNFVSNSSGNQWTMQTDEQLITKFAGKRLTKAEVITELASASSTQEFMDDDDTLRIKAEATATSSKLFVGNLSFAGEDGVETTSSNGRKTVRAHDFLTGLSDTGSVFELTAAEDEALLRLSSGNVGSDADASMGSRPGESFVALTNTGTSGFFGMNVSADDSGSGLDLYTVFPSASGSKSPQVIANRAHLRQNESDMEFIISHAGSGGSDGVHITSDATGGRVGINNSSPSVALHVGGDICYTGGISACSDLRYKKNIGNLGEALQLVKQLDGVRFCWRTDEFVDMKFSDARQIGFIAQNVERVLPEVVFTDDAGYKSVDYSRLTPVLVEAVKEQQSEIASLKAELAQLRAMVKQLADARDSAEKYSLK